MNDAEKKCIMNNEIIQQKIYRMALEILEANMYYSHLALVALNDKAFMIANLLQKTIMQKSDIMVNIYKTSGKDSDVKLVDSLPTTVFNNTPVILCDDVSNSGRTMAYAFHHIMQYEPVKIETLVLAERSHKMFPLEMNYKGMSINTTLEERIDVVIVADTLMEAYLF
jgi:pyrimidine operon attenuation protein / uracil phosphoribosyltransferase